MRLIDILQRFWKTGQDLFLLYFCLIQIVCLALHKKLRSLTVRRLHACKYKKGFLIDEVYVKIVNGLTIFISSPKTQKSYSFGEL